MNLPYLGQNPIPNKNRENEKYLQFGTGVLLRGLIDDFIDENQKKDSVVIVKSMAATGADEFEQQNGRYTICVRGIDQGQIVEKDQVNTAISRVLSAQSHWDSILELAKNPNLDVVISNTTEVGLQYLEESIFQSPPVSYPAKLLAFLHAKYKAGLTHKMVVIPTELLVNNADILKNILNKLIVFNKLDVAFNQWLTNHVIFCNSLVDRIVPGKPNEEKLAGHWKKLGYQDNLLFETEVYRLWAIQGNNEVREILGLKADGLVIADDIEIYRELKLRLLNATHTLMCGWCIKHGEKLTRESMNSTVSFDFAKSLMINEIAPSIPYDIEQNVKETYALRVLDRFKNPFIDHQWQSITLQYTMKLKMRVLPLINKHYILNETAPKQMAEAFAAYISFMKPVESLEGKFYGEMNSQKYLINCDSAAVMAEHWKNSDVVHSVLSDTKLWGQNLSELPGFEQEIKSHLN